MAQDFIFTSQRETGGIGCVAQTEGSKNCIPNDLTYDISSSDGVGYSAKDSPIMYAFTRHETKTLPVVGRKMTSNILSRISRRSSTDRANYLAHHLVLSEDEMNICKAGPVWLLKHRHWVEDWKSIEKKQYEQTCLWSNGDVKRKPTLWQKTFGEDHWHENLWKLIGDNEDTPLKCSILFDPKKHVSELILDLFYEALLQLPEEKRWSVTFSTFATKKHISFGWDWTGLDVNDKDAQAKFISPKSRFIDLNNPNK